MSARVPRSRFRRGSVAVATAAIALALAAPGVAAGPVLDRAGAELKATPVFVDPAAERPISAAEAAELRTLIQQGETPIFVAVLPLRSEEEAGGIENLPQAVADVVGFPGTYAVVTPTGFRADSNVLSGTEAIATAAFQRQRDNGAAAVLREFVTRVQTQARTGTDGDGAGTPGVVGDERVAVEREDGGVGVFGFFFVVALVGGGVWLFVRGRRKRAEQERQEQAQRQMLRAELAVLGDDVLSLEPQVVLHPDAKDDFDAAVSRFQAASAALDYADDPVDLIRVERVVAESRYAMARTRARIDGREPPPPPADLQQPGRHNEPPVELDEDRRPRYRDGGPFHGDDGWYRGNRDRGGGLLDGLLLGTVLSGGLGGGHHHHDHGTHWPGGDDHSDRHDSGGFMGGMAGGGDWGSGGSGGDMGGDAGGGDW